MALLSPIGTLILFSGSTGVIEIFPTMPDYNPSLSTDYVPATPDTEDFIGVFSKADIGGVEVSHDAIFMIDTDQAPAGILPEKSRCTVNGETYTIMAVQDRWYLSERDGLTLHLAEAA